MKRIVFFLFISNSIIGFTQANLIDESISFIGNKPPAIFNRLDNGYFVNKDFFGNNLLLIINFRSNLVDSCELSNRFSTLEDGQIWLDHFLDIINENNWKYLGRYANKDIYSKNGIFLLVTSPYLTIKHDIVSIINITKDLWPYLEGIVLSEVIRDLQNQ